MPLSRRPARPREAGAPAPKKQRLDSEQGAADAQIAVKRDNAGRVLTEVEFMKDGPEGPQTVSP